MLKEGNFYTVRCKEARLYCSSTTAPYPYWDKKYIPIFVLKEYPTFFLVTTLEHHGSMFGKAKPYNVTLDKTDLKNGIFEIRG